MAVVTGRYVRGGRLLEVAFFGSVGMFHSKIHTRIGMITYV
jgi:hypothetical protein